MKSKLLQDKTGSIEESVVFCLRIIMDLHVNTKASVKYDAHEKPGIVIHFTDSSQKLSQMKAIIDLVSYCLKKGIENIFYNNDYDSNNTFLLKSLKLEKYSIAGFITSQKRFKLTFDHGCWYCSELRSAVIGDRYTLAKKIIKHAKESDFYLGYRKYDDSAEITENKITTSLIIALSNKNLKLAELLYENDIGWTYTEDWIGRTAFTEAIKNCFFNFARKIKAESYVCHGIETCIDRSWIVSPDESYGYNFPNDHERALKNKVVTEKQEALINDFGLELLSECDYLERFLCLAIKNKRTDYVSSILDNKEYNLDRLYITGAAGKRKLAFSVLGTSAEIFARVLKEKNFCLDITDEEGYTVLMRMLYLNLPPTFNIGLVVSHPNTNINYVNEQGFTALCLAVMAGRKEFIVEMLRHQAIDLSIKYKSAMFLDADKEYSIFEIAKDFGVEELL